MVDLGVVLGLGLSTLGKCSGREVWLSMLGSVVVGRGRGRYSGSGSGRGRGMVEHLG